MNADAEFVKAAANLARSNPAAWQAFMVQMQVYSSTQIGNLVQSPLEHLALAQGRAQAVARLHGILVDCVASADKLESKSK
jgi:hypothetical protein